MHTLRYSLLNRSHVQRTLLSNQKTKTLHFSTLTPTSPSPRMFEFNAMKVNRLTHPATAAAARCGSAARLLGTVATSPKGVTTTTPEAAEVLSDTKVKTTVYTIPKSITQFIDEAAKICKPDKIHICDGSETEYENLVNLMVQSNMAIPLPKYDNCYLVRTDPKDVARVESRTIISTANKRDVVPRGHNPHPGALPNWMSPEELQEKLGERFPGCMKGRTMYVIPFSMGPVGSPLSKIGIQCTDSPYVVVSMRIMTRMGIDVLKILDEKTDFVKCLHSVGSPITSKTSNQPLWPCNPEKTLITHKPESNEILSFGSGYGGNSLLGKKCLALRLGSFMARKESWLAEHMLILGITNPQGVKKYVAAAFPSACGKTNLAMMTPKLPGWKVECVGDDIAWMRFDGNGVLRAINPENGFFGVAPGTGHNTNPIAMETVFKDTVFTNVGYTSDDGGVYWEGMGGTQSEITDWKGNKFVKGQGVAAHPNSRFCTPAKNCPIMDPLWESPEGVPISAILFGGRRPEGVPLVYEAFNWDHGVYMGASMRSEATAAAEHQGKVIMHDPFAMRPFVGYNMGEYFGHWVGFGKKDGLKLPKIFHVNWFRKDEQGKFLWPGFGENVRVLDWIMKRMDESTPNTQIATESPIGVIPRKQGFDLEGLDTSSLNWEELFKVDKSFWKSELEQISKYFNDNIGEDLPTEIREQVDGLKRRVQ